MNVLFGRLFQMIGMILLPIGLLYGLAKNQIDIEVRLLFIGAAFFVAGWLLARQRR
jgi:uncharacterized membrane protein YhfC